MGRWESKNFNKDKEFNPFHATYKFTFCPKTFNIYLNFAVKFNLVLDLYLSILTIKEINSFSLVSGRVQKSSNKIVDIFAYPAVSI